MRGARLVACFWLALAGCKKEAAGPFDASRLATDGGGAARAVVDARRVAAADAVAAPADAAAARAADAHSGAAADGGAATMAALRDGGAPAAPARDGAVAAAPGDARAAAPPSGSAPAEGEAAWREIGAAALAAVQKDDPRPIASLFPPFRAATAACESLYPDTARKRAEWAERTARQGEELEEALRACAGLTSWKGDHPAAATWDAPSPVEACDELAESDLRIIDDPGGEAGAAGTRYTITVHVVVLSDRPYPTALRCGVRAPR